MKKYLKPVSIGQPSKTPLPIYPVLQTTEPPTNTELFTIHDNSGAYLGWSTPEEVRKFLYGRLYYKTKGKIKIDTQKQGGDKHVRLKEKLTGTTSAVFVHRNFSEADMIDPTDVRAKAQHTLDSILSNKNITKDWQPFDQFGLLSPITKKMQAEKEAVQLQVVQNGYKEVVAHLKDIIASQDTLAQASAQSRVDMKF